MTKHELLTLVEKFSDDMEIMILDGENGGGSPRAINLGPCTQVVQQSDADDVADCEDIVGKEVVVLGYGCY